MQMAHMIINTPLRKHVKSRFSDILHVKCLDETVSTWTLSLPTAEAFSMDTLVLKFSIVVPQDVSM